MNPIFEQQSGEGIGYNYEYFLKRFLEICESHLKNGRAKSFAFILYDFHDKQIRKILKTQGGFAKLDRLSGFDLSIFYINSEDKRLISSFNKIFLGAFEIKKKAKLPSVLFFKVENKDVIDVKIVELVQDNILFSFQELYTTIESYLGKQ
ncbi:hypothetical protein N7U66_05320 [Lacinutrix neustonica]|uniref:Uncharacterized protein n=1 Tax=Lacinutrix neustonica TaxID=2980107 RepID=A0A9E8SF61_9FLAO|nr:hypothetical protein [Lacinutrix neustonica]WAC03049.1 hypothetical protein N7U66_05320 [Lacinutrix neustonica]